MKSSELLRQVGDGCWEDMLKESPMLWVVYGTDKLPDVSQVHAAAEAAFAREMLSRLESVAPSELSHEEDLSLEILKWQLRDAVEDVKHYWLNIPITPYTCPIPFVQRILEAHRLADRADLDHYLMLVRRIPALVRAVLSKVQRQTDMGIVAPQEELQLVVPFLRSLICPGPQSGFYVNNKRLTTLGRDDRSRFQEKLVQSIDSEVNPALEELAAFVEGPYRARAPEPVGMWQYPGGAEYYQRLVKMHTTLDVTPEQVHRTGLEQLRILGGAMDEMRRTVGFGGSKADLLRFLKTDPQFFPRTPEEIGGRLTGYLNGIRARVDQYFDRRPKADCAVKRLPLELEGSQTFGYYEAPTATEPKGYYNYNGSNLNQRTLLTAEHLTYHELMPGHYFHIALQRENEDLPNWRPFCYEGAFNEGWAEYAATLAREMGLYQDPYQWCGRLQSEIFLSTRLVVDTGMNASKWPRSQAVKLMQENLLESATQIHTESLRYSVDMPGQALAYRMGYLKLHELRVKAEKALGGKFDLRRYNSALVGSGAMPLPVLEKHVHWYIQQEKLR